MNMNSRLRAKYVAYNGDYRSAKGDLIPQTQYGMGRSGNGNGKRPQPHNVTEDFKAACARESKNVGVRARVMVVDAKTGHKVMQDLVA